MWAEATAWSRGGSASENHRVPDIRPHPNRPLSRRFPLAGSSSKLAKSRKVAIVGTAFLLSVSRALARIHVEHDSLRRSPPAHLVDPLTGQIGESNKVLGPAQPLRFETPHLAG